MNKKYVLMILSVLFFIVGCKPDVKEKLNKSVIVNTEKDSVQEFIPNFTEDKEIIPDWIEDKYLNIQQLHKGWNYGNTLKEHQTLREGVLSYFVIHNYDGGCERSVLYTYGQSTILDSLIVEEVCDNGSENEYSYFEYIINKNEIIITTHVEFWNDTLTLLEDKTYSNDDMYNDPDNWIVKQKVDKYVINNVGRIIKQ